MLGERTQVGFLDGLREAAFLGCGAQTGGSATARRSDSTPGDSLLPRLDARRQEDGQNGPFVSPTAEFVFQLSPNVESVSHLSPTVESAHAPTSRCLGRGDPAPSCGAELTEHVNPVEC